MTTRYKYILSDGYKVTNLKTKEAGMKSMLREMLTQEQQSGVLYKLTVNLYEDDQTKVEVVGRIYLA